MAKKGLLVLILATIVVMGTYAAPPDFRISIGGGGYFTSDFGGGAEWESGSWRMAYETPYAGGGGFLFFDLTYVELSFGLFTGGGDMRSVVDMGSLGSDSASFEYSLTGIDIGIMGKYPFVLNSKLSLFPLLGINYRNILTLKDEEGNEADEPGDYSTFWIKLGGGLDYSFADNIFLRFGLTYGMRFPNQFEEYLFEYIDEYTNDISNPDSRSSSIGPRQGHGLEIKLAVGFRF